MSLHHSSRWGPDRLSRWAGLVVLLVILIAAAAFRLYQIGQAPPGPHYDEAAAALDALDVLDGKHMVFSPRSYGREMLFVYVAAPLVRFLGPTKLALRLPTALVGVLTVLATYLLARELLHGEGKHRARWTALLAAAFLALSFWHVVLNRLAFRASYLPLTETLCFLFLFRALRTGRIHEYVLSGTFLGLGLYTYTAARFVPVVLVLFFLALLLTRQGQALVLPRWHRWALLGFVALVVSAPLLLFFATHPGDFVLRARGISILNPQLHQGDFWGLLVRSVLGNLAMFGFKGDGNWLYNIPGRPGLDPFGAVLFWLGLVLCLVHWRRPRDLFLPLWCLVMLLPSILAPDPIPHSLRAIGALPAACILSARAAGWLLFSLAQRFPRLPRAVPRAVAALLLCYLVWLGYSTWHSYFRLWLPREEVYYAHYGHMADLAARINSDRDPQAVYLFPVNYDRRGEDYQEYPLELLHQGPVPFHYIIVDDSSVARDLAGFCQGKERVHLIVWTHGQHVDADPRQVLPFLLERCGQQTAESFYRGYRIVTYELLSPVAVCAPLDWMSWQGDLGNQISLVAQARDPSSPSGEPIPVALRWLVQQPMPQEYKASLRLFDAQGHLSGQGDTLLLSNEHRTTSAWEPGDVVTTTHLLPILPATMPGPHQLRLVVYDAESLAPIPVVAGGGSEPGDALDLGSLTVGRPSRPAAVDPEAPLSAVPLAPDIQLVGYALDRGPFVPGTTMKLALYWQAQRDIAQDYTVVLELVGSEGEVAAERAEKPAYPTSEWQAGDLWRDWHELAIGADLPGGEYELAVGLQAAGSGAGRGEGVRASLGSLQLQARGALFQAPPIDHPLVAELGTEIRLLGYALAEERVRAGDSLHLTLYWQAVSAPEESYTVFTHLLDANARLYGQKDSVPAGGTLPTTLWVPGEIIVDEYEIPVSADAPPGEYLLEVGMYQAATGQRLPIRDEAGGDIGDRLLLDSTVRVER